MNDNTTTLEKVNTILTPKEALERAYERIENESFVAEGRSYEIDREIDEDNFCDDCDEIWEDRESEEYWGAHCYRVEQRCPADFDPECKRCCRHSEYVELSQEKARCDVFTDKVNDIILPAIEKKLKEIEATEIQEA